MTEEPLSKDQTFIIRLTDIVLSNLRNENFGVNELARLAGLSRSVIHRKLRTIKKQNITQFIREIRLIRAMELLHNHSGPASDVAYTVGFGSPAYFNKCFHETYGFPPGEVKKRELSGADKNLTDLQNIKTGYGHIQVSKKNYRPLLKRFNNKTIPVVFLGIFAGLIIIFITYTLIIKGINQNKKMNSPYADKSIVVIPFKNLSGDPENQPLADGVTEDILNNLFRISKLRVISKTTSEYLSGKAMTSPEIARKLNVNYILEGSVIRDGKRVRIYVQLVDARNDRHLLSERFENEITGIFEIQSDIAKKVADELEVVITSKEIGQIEKM